MDPLLDVLTVYPAPWPTDSFPTLRARLDRARRRDPAGWEDARQEAIVAVLAALNAPGSNPVNLERAAHAAIERALYKPGSRGRYSQASGVKSPGGKPSRLPVTQVSEHSADLRSPADQVFESATLEDALDELRLDVGAFAPIIDELLADPSISVRALREKYPVTRRQVEAIRQLVGLMARDSQREAGLQRPIAVQDAGSEFTARRQELELEALGRAHAFGGQRPRHRVEHLRFGLVQKLRS